MTVRTPGWYGTPKPAPELRGWLTTSAWFRAHYFAGMSAPLCNKASADGRRLVTPTNERRCDHCARALSAQAR